MSYVPHTEHDRKEMFEKIGVTSFDELIENIPEEFRLKDMLNLPVELSEYETVRLLSAYSSRNKTASSHLCFMGGGAYDHFIPSVVDMVLLRSEFKTAYTPYQAEVSQGTLQAMYEFQSMIAELTGMDVSNASLYDGGTAMAEACLLASAHNRRNKIIFAGTINPLYVSVCKTICAGKNLEFINVVSPDGTTDIAHLESLADNHTSAVIVQHPNFYGNLEQVHEIETIAHKIGALFVVSACPFSMGILEAPGKYNADIVVGEGQPLGIPLSFGGPFLGIFATKMELVRKIPGRLSGVTEDLDGKRVYVLTLQTREQQIKREKATSNICTNQGLFMLAATAYMETMGKQGIKDVSEQSFQRSHYLAGEIAKIPGFSLANDKPFFREFLVKTPVAPAEIIKSGLDKGFLAGIDTSVFSELTPGLLIAVTEKRSKEDMDNFVNFLKEFAR